MGKFAWICVIAVLAMGDAANAAPATDAQIAEAQAALGKGDALGAANLADAGLNDETLSPGQRGRLFLYRGLAEELLGFHDPAMRDFTAALDTGALPASERAQALLQRGFLLDGLGQLDDAAKDYSAVIALKGDSLATALNNRANIYRRQNRFANARHDYQAALSAAGGKPQYSWYGLGQIAEAEADPGTARAFYAKAVAADPAYALASERLTALGGPPENSIASAQGQVVLHPPGSASTADDTAQAAKEATVAPRASGHAAAHAAIASSWHQAREQGRQMPANEKTGGAKIALRPALDQAAAAVPRAGKPQPAAGEVQLGAWRSEEEANAGWNAAKLRAAGALDGFRPHIVTAELPGKGRFFRLRVSVEAGKNQSDLCANLTAKGVACLPAKD
jgi:hypothetical protein